ncbi:MAG: peptidase [Bdellovibrio sp. ArHS]|uniref:EcsC family protein n=1 Tax=Bdellovibrio sp. ArHS TaxID=1569284 RepID=UPI0005832924|nr:EcsC family protein [Bdellovibrio sp. ArHS]KHD89207.1 MAG: peptidase [Bdellovibrio sp. ArHS]
MQMDSVDLQSLRIAKELLERPGITARIAAKIGTPVEKGLALLPDRLQKTVHRAAEKSIHIAYDIAMRTVEPSTKKDSNNLGHKLAVAGTGGAGGFLGPASLLIELPISTTLMMRSIIDIAQSEGEDIADVDTKLACLEVFAFGGLSTADDAAGSGYIMTRAALSKAFTDAAKSVLGKSLAEETAPLFVRLFSSIASRFQVVVAEKVAAQLIPLVGALGGATINVIFMDHFQDMARGHFVVRRLERKYGINEVQTLYRELII